MNPVAASPGPFIATDVTGASRELGTDGTFPHSQPWPNPPASRSPILLPLRQHFDVSRQLEQIVFQIPVDPHVVGEHLEDLLPVPLAPDVAGTLHPAAHVPVQPEHAHFRVEVLELFVAPPERLPHRQLV